MKVLVFVTLNCDFIQQLAITSLFSVALLQQSDYCPIYLQIGNLLQNIENLFLFQQSNTGYSKSRSLRFTNENVFFCTLKESPVPPFMLCYSQFCPISVVLQKSLNLSSELQREKEREKERERSQCLLCHKLKDLLHYINAISTTRKYQKMNNKHIVCEFLCIAIIILMTLHNNNYQPGRDVGGFV